ncbi:diaminobutyrate--2-oxoglutarate transaminase family protein [Patulibacter brassicae]|uniref:Diaminobutyrate--2-oxoglutarate transaminase n=1 Tax=Patulibacter brassicae TaxID=1705717 RepID=A0ABU4VFZ8_9ACTN|nr:diaminobutyrate--2-oxoglutarate transaminase family protein [Patulibacter brassicae]MDX8150733.1 diaminobutyrate--2-oxoglutarate transaminase family protein [Patulibacter brassicae]
MIPTHTDAILDRQAARESSARTYARWLGAVPVRARGAELETADGRVLLDCLAGAGTLALGHNHPEVVGAIEEVLASGAPLHALDFATPWKDDLTTELLAALPEAFRRTRPRLHFCGPAGTDAVEAAIKLCQTGTGRQGILAFTGAYHGMTLGALAASAGVATKAPVAGLGTDVTRLPFPYALRCPFGLGPHGATVSARYVERLLDDPNGGVVPPALMLLEAVQGEGGVVPAPDEWLRTMRRITERHGIRLVVDEVQSGVGRTGTMWAHERAGIVPDAIVMSKAIGGSLPLAVVAYRGDLDGWAPGAHTGTFRGTTLAMATGAATLRVVRRDRLAERAGRLGAWIAEELRERLAGHPAVAEVRGRGLMLGVELVDPAGAPDGLGVRPAAPRLAAAVRAACLERGLIVELGGRHDSVVRLLPPLVLSDAQAERVVAVLGDVVRTEGDRARGAALEVAA